MEKKWMSNSIVFTILLILELHGLCYRYRRYHRLKQFISYPSSLYENETKTRRKTMVLTVQQTTAFFTDAAQMGIPQDTYTQMAIEGIVTVGDLAEFKDENHKDLADNLRRPGGGNQAFVFGARSQMRLKASSKLIRFMTRSAEPMELGIYSGNRLGRISTTNLQVELNP